MLMGGFEPNITYHPVSMQAAPASTPYARLTTCRSISFDFFLSFDFTSA